ncbi:P450-derived glycosyltransferase activator [Streptomyces kanamyceticus]|uniref:P450-derived glycosyltransferase activator n=1 Tax=Streptomyces kanamyceticus TaxID=1967 RepID=A0A5J6GQE1_STRKN|nr:P450-derived glycosyltransferase activator [Streptomyces kanamyceticus]QEU96265.1 P450-derived glycosyltransferase activator [Streptomyces kanamyceticus]
MISTKTDSDLGPELMTLRGMQWIYGIKNDPYALLLRAESDEPHALGRQAREHGALMWSTAETWVTARYDTASALLSDPRLGVHYPRPEPGAGDEEAMAWQIPALHDVLPLGDVSLALDRASYRRLRGQAVAAVGTGRPAFAAELAKRSEGQLDLLDTDFDLMTDFAHPLAAHALADLLGVAVADRERFAGLCVDVAPALDATLCPPRLVTARELITAAREIGELLGAPASDRGADDERASRLLLAVAGVQLAANLTARTVSALLDHPEAWASVRDDAALAPAAVRETVRYAPPVRLQQLFAHEDVKVKGTTITAGRTVTVLVEAANRDPEAFTEPDRFDLGREAAAAPLTFVDDLYTGTLEPFATAVATAGVATLAARLPALRRAAPELRRLRAPVTGGVLRMPVTGTAG